MTEVVPEGSHGTARVDHFSVSEADVRFHDLRCSINRMAGFNRVDEGRFCRLLIDGDTVMSDTRMERLTNREVVKRSRGDVLLAGLGLGMVVHAVAAKQEVTSVTVVEKNPDVIKLISPSLPTFVQLLVVEADIFQYKPDWTYDTIYFDIWSGICTDNLPEIAKLHQRGKYWLRRDNGTPWMGSWMQDHLRDLRRSGRWR